MTLEAVVRYCPSSTSCPFLNAGWDTESGKMYFGEHFVIDDVLGHELTHGVTSYESNLIYQNESGAINESLSDIFGEFIDQTNGSGTDTTDVKWFIGEDLVPQLSVCIAYLAEEWSCAPAMRNMKDPPAFRAVINTWPFLWLYPDRYNSDNRWTRSSDNGGVHINCTINDKLCYLLTDGGTFNGRTVTSMGMDLVAALYYECQVSGLLTEAADFFALYYAMEQAAVNLGLSEAQRRNIDEACKAVEIRPTSFVTLRGDQNRPLVRFSNAGDIFLLSGASIHTNQSITLDPNVDEFAIRNSSGVVLTKVDSQSGDLYLKGDLHEDVCVVWDLPDDDYVAIRNDDEIVAYINGEGFFELFLGGWVPAGSLILDGHAVYVEY